MSELQGSDRAALAALQAGVGERLRGLSGLVEGALAGQGQHFAAVAADLAAFR